MAKSTTAGTYLSIYMAAFFFIKIHLVSTLGGYALKFDSEQTFPPQVPIHVVIWS